MRGDLLRRLRPGEARPGPRTAVAPDPDDEIPDNPSEYWMYAGVGRKGQ
ncbi:hypothetical protein ACWGQ5_01610 [Streptomyces sp. NPDC055722]